MQPGLSACFCPRSTVALALSASKCLTKMCGTFCANFLYVPPKVVGACGFYIDLFGVSRE